MTSVHAALQRDAHFVSYVDLAEAEGAEVGAGLLHCRLDRLPEQFLHKLADVRPHLFHRLRGRERELSIKEKLWSFAGPV